MEAAKLLGDTMELWEVCIVGMGIVFLGLICLIIICSIMGIFFKGKKAGSKPEVVIPPAKVEIPNRGEFIAAVSAAIAEDMGTEIEGIRIVSIKQL